jgi:SAM-dependent methyltransferase
MSSGGDDKATFLSRVEESLAAGTFVRMTLGKYRGAGDAHKVVATPVTLKDKPQLKFVTSHARQDVTQNFAIPGAITHMAALIGGDYLSATLFTTQDDLTLQFSKKKATTLSRAKPTFTAPPAPEHNRAKQYMVDPARPYLKALGVTQEGGIVKPSMYPKFKQICHFVEIVDQLISESELAAAPALSVTDIGSGKGYLTFALYDHLTTKLGKAATVIGVDVRADMVKLCAEIAARSGFDRLFFEAALAGNAKASVRDVIIALHACDTATDDAIYQGITAGAALIVTAPCCQHELAPQLDERSERLAGLMKFGLFKQRLADLATDTARCLLLEASGYCVKVIEFVSTEHTAKNILIAAIRSNEVDRARAEAQYAALKAEMGFTTQHLEMLLKR